MVMPSIHRTTKLRAERKTFQAFYRVNILISHLITINPNERPMEIRGGIIWHIRIGFLMMESCHRLSEFLRIIVRSGDSEEGSVRFAAEVNHGRRVLCKYM